MSSCRSGKVLDQVSGRGNTKKGKEIGRHMRKRGMNGFLCSSHGGLRKGGS